MSNTTADTDFGFFSHPTRRAVIADNALVAVVVGLQHAEARGWGGLTTLPTVTVSLTVNGWLYTLTLDPRATPPELLRERVDLTRTKKDCDQSQRGAYTVPIDGRRANSCLAFSAMDDGAQITTIEGLAAKGTSGTVAIRSASTSSVRSASLTSIANAVYRTAEKG
jgi:hypothetical protein